MLAGTFYKQAKSAFAGCDEEMIFSRLTDAVKLLVNKGINDANLGELELCVCDGCVTLPRDVGTVLGIDVCGQPTLIQDQWFKYHINGPGAQGGCGVITEMGQVCTWKDPSQPCYLAAEITSAADNGKKLRVYALDEKGNKIYSKGPGGTLEEGFSVPMVFGFQKPAPGIPPLSSIYRVIRDQTRDYVRLVAINADDGKAQTQVGYYEPDETVPQYRRIKIPHKSSVMVKYKKATLEITSMRSWINIDNNEALRLACRAVKFRSEDKYTAAAAAENEAARILTEETQSKLPAGPRVPQIINQIYDEGGDDSLIYGNNRWGRW